MRSWHLIALGERIRARLVFGLVSAGFLLVLLVLLVLAPSPANAQDSPGVTLASEWRCEKAVSAAMARYARDATSCHLTCEAEAVSDPSRDCSRFSDDPGILFCLDRARARVTRRVLRECTAEACPECYRGGSCDSFVAQRLAALGGSVELRARQIACVGEGADAGRRELRCRDKLETRIAAHHRRIQGCFEDCFSRERKGVVAPGACSDSNDFTGADAEPGLGRCIQRAQVRFLRGCLSCAEEISCVGLGSSSSETCSTLMAAVESDALPVQEAVFCVDDVRCGDNRIGVGEQCDGNDFSCGFRDFCNDQCECEALPAVCGDGIRSEGEECDSPNTSGLECPFLVEFCNEDCVCEETPDVCGDGLLHPSEDCDVGIEFFCSGRDFCNAECACEEPPALCGDGIVSGDEACDASRFRDNSCDPSELCAEDCSECVPRPEVCGDGFVSGDEQCDPNAVQTGCSSIAQCSDACVCENFVDTCDNPEIFPSEGGSLDVVLPASDGIYRPSCETTFGAERAFAWSPVAAGTWVIDSCEPASGEVFAPFTALSVREDVCRAGGREIECSSFDCPNSAGARIELSADPSKIYYVMLDSDFGGQEVAVRLRIRPVYGSADRAFLVTPGSLLE
ncbi:MAG: hypothetical protein P8K76_15235 [Candidatus Binatia bacterium]|nr:hypothetical protein [Candidatus Binatia bacterium]